MKIKQIKNTLLTLIVLAASFASSIAISSPTFAYACPTGQEYHASDNACWTADSKSVTKGNRDSFASKCAGGTVSNANGNTATCTIYTRSNAAPTNDDGSAATLSCPTGQEYHASDNKCWTADSKSVTKGNRDSFASKCAGGTVSNANGNTATCTIYKEGSNPTIDPANPSDPNASLNYCDKTYVTEGKDNQTANRQACIAGQEGKDCATTYAAAGQEAQKAACESGVKNPSATPPLNGTSKTPSTSGDAGTCGNAKVNIVSCNGNGCESGDNNDGVACIANVLKIVLFILTMIIGIVATGGIVYAAVLYASAQDNSGQVSQAKTIIRDVVIGIVLYGFMIAIVNWLVPGGVIG